MPRTSFLDVAPTLPLAMLIATTRDGCNVAVLGRAL